MTNFKNLNKFIPYEHFKMEGLHCLRFLLEQDDLPCKIDLKVTYLSVPLNKNFQKFVKFQWYPNATRISLPMFWTQASSTNLYKIIEVPIALLRQVNIRIIIYLDDMLLVGRTLPEILMARSTLIFL